jgi:hypothetical protein
MLYVVYIQVLTDGISTGISRVNKHSGLLMLHIVNINFINIVSASTKIASSNQSEIPRQLIQAPKID